MAPKLRKQADDSQVGQTPEDENNVNSKENEQVEGLQTGPETRTGQDLNVGIGQTSRMNTRNNKTVHVDDPKNPEVGDNFEVSLLLIYQSKYLVSLLFFDFLSILVCIFFTC